LIDLRRHLRIGTIAKNEGYGRKQEDLSVEGGAFRRLIELGLSAKKTGAKVKA
jgi:hypothetical protein